MEEIVKDYVPEKSDRVKAMVIGDQLLDSLVNVKENLDKYFEENKVSNEDKVEFCSAYAYLYNLLSIMYSKEMKEGAEDEGKSADS